MGNLLEIKELYTKSTDSEQKEILKGLNLNIRPGEVHVIMGPNGSGKSTLANTILNNPRYAKTSGEILFEGNNINDSKTSDIAKMGVFMSFQTPVEIPGVTVAHFLKTIKNSVSEEKVNLYTFQKEARENMAKLDIDESYLNRDLNVGFSGGEKKKQEILQLLTLNPKLAILDETDSGLDVDAIKVVSNGINLFRNNYNAVLIITHSTKILENLDNYYVHILVNGKIVADGDMNLAKEIEANGYKDYINNED